MSGICTECQLLLNSCNKDNTIGIHGLIAVEVRYGNMHCDNVEVLLVMNQNIVSQI
jgi:hypothetical protein